MSRATRSQPDLRLVDDGAEAEAERNRAAVEAHRANVARLRELASTAIATLADALNDDDPRVRLQAAGLVLRAVKLADVGQPDGPTTPEAVRQDRALTALIGGR